MIFHEIYSCYYNAVAKIIALGVKGELTEKAMKEIIEDNAFRESFLNIIPALKNQQWQLITEDFKTPMKKPPSQPLSLLEKRWLKAITLDPRIRLFNISLPGLEEVKPLFTPEDYVVFDKYTDGDDYGDEGYIKIFQTLIKGIKERRRVKISYLTAKGKGMEFYCKPCSLEYSEKDDKFRLTTSGCRYINVINISNINKCTLLEGYGDKVPPKKAPIKKALILELFDGRNALERAMLHFAHFDKEAEKLEGNKYRVKINYDKADEIELVIRVLSFGPMIKVLEPEGFISLIKERLLMQKKLR
ncbi:WYL domain-containing protein [Alloiococcus sp. CFN-8]|uniref:WYL domain-containing protein n=1 Tax=Alloiococcus sp. CFN-8 TaxID=3416081 RepID=UPI003CE9CED9